MTMKPSYRKFFQYSLHRIVVFLTSFGLVVPMPVLMAQSPAIVPDGRTQTTVTSDAAGTVTDVRTDTIRGNSGYNSFERFNVPGGNTTNLYVPDGAKNLINLVHGERSQIDGILNAYKDGQIGGNVFFLNPHGIVIGAGGVVNVGSLHMQTPTADYLKQLVDEHGEVSVVHEQMLFNGNVPINPSGTISVKGKINAIEAIQLAAGNIDLQTTSRLRAGRQVQVEFGDMVNTRSLNWGNDLLVTPEGKIKIVATGDVSVTGSISADAASGEKAGRIEIRAGNDIDVGAGAEITARGLGQGSDGGEVVVFADNDSYLQNGALIDVGAENGKGGFVEFSAKNTVDMEGNGLRSSHGGTILIDPANIVWTGSGNDVYTNGANYTLEADSTISLTDVYISTRNVDASGRQAHWDDASRGGSGNIVLSANEISLNNVALLAFATENYAAGSVTISGGTIRITDGSNISAGDFVVRDAENITFSGAKVLADRIYLEAENEISILGSNLKTRKIHTRNPDDPESPADLTINVLQNDSNLSDVGVDRTAKITIDKDSVLEGNDILVQAVVSAGTHLDTIELKDENGNVVGYKVVNENGEEVDYEELYADNVGMAETLIDSLADMLGDFTTPVLAGGRGYNANAEISISGKLTAENSIEISSTAAALSSAFVLGIAGVGVNVSVVKPESRITIGPDAVLTAVNGDISVESVVMAGIAQSTFNLVPVGANMVGVVAGVGVLVSRNNIDIQSGAELQALNGNIRVAALTERSVSISATGGKGNDSLAATLAFVYEETDTHVSVGGKLTALSADIYAITNVEDNTLSVKTTLGETMIGGLVGTVDYFVPAISSIKAGVFGLINKIAGTELGKNPDQFRDFGTGLSLAVMVDNNDTSTLIAGTADITVRDYLDVEALTHDVPVAIAVTTINSFVLNEGENKSTKETAVGASAPVLVILQNTNAEIQGGATVRAGGDVVVNSITELPYNLDHPVAQLILNSDDVAVTDFLTLLMNNNFGLDNGLFNTWSQTSIESEETAAAMMLSVVYTDIETVARIGDGVTIGGLPVGNPFGAAYDDLRPDLSVTAYTDIEMGHVVGNMRSFLRQLPNAKAPGVATSPLSFASKMDFGNTYRSRMKDAWSNKGTKAKQAFGDMFQSMWGNQSGKGVGAGISFNWLDGTAKAEIGAATLNVKDLTVDAETYGFDLMVGLGASKTEEWGLTGTAGTSVFNVDSHAKIDDSARVTAAGNVNIGAKDSTRIIGVAGNLTMSEGSAFGLSVVVPVVIRDVRAVWGNYIDENDALATARVVSVVAGDVNVNAEASGLTVVAAVAGAVTAGVEQPSQKMANPEDTLKNANDSFDAIKKTLSSADQGLILALLEDYQRSMTGSGGGGSTSSVGVAGAVGVNLLIEDVYAGIGGNVSITAGSFEIEAVNKVVDAALVGGVVAQLGSSGSNSGVAGAVGVNLLFGDTKAFVDTRGGTLTYSDEFSVEANRGGYVGALTAGGAGSASSQGFEVAGSLSVALIQSETIAEVKNTTVTKIAASTTGDMIVGAANEALIVNIAGGLAIGGNIGVGLSLASSNLVLDTRVFVGESTITAGDFLATATAESLLVTVALGGGVAHSGSVGVGGTVAVVTSDGDTSVEIADSTLTLDGDFIAYVQSDTFSGTDDTYGDLIAYLADTERNSNEEDEKSTYFNDQGEEVTFDKSEVVYDTDGNAVRNDTTETKDVRLGLSARSPRIVTAALAFGYGQSAGVGANLGINLVAEETFVSIAGSNITAKNAVVQAKTEGGMIAAAVGVGASQSVGVAGNLGVNLVGGRTEVVFDDSTLTATTGNIDVSSESTGGIVNASLTVGAGQQAGVGVGFSYNMFAHSVAVDLNESTLEAASGAVNFEAMNNSDLIGVLLNIGAGQTAGVGVSLAINTIGSIDLSDADLETPEDTQKDFGDREKDLEIVFDTTGGNPGDVIGSARNRTAINIVESSISAGKDVTMDAFSGGGMISISAAVGGGKTAGVGVGAAYNSIGGSVGIFGLNSTMAARTGSVVGSSQIGNAMYGITVGGGVGGTAGVGTSVGANVLKATNEISLSADSKSQGKIEAGADIVFKATNSGEVVGSSLALAGGQYAGVAAALTVNVLKGVTNVRLTNADLTAGDSIVLDAETANELYAITGALALSVSGSGSASVGATVAVNDVKSVVGVRIVDSALTADGNVLVHSNVDTDLLAVTGNAAVAVALFGASVAGSVTYNGVHSTNEITITGSSIDARAVVGGDFDGLAENYGIAGLSGSFKDRKGVGIGAYSHGEIENYFFLIAAATMAGVGVGTPVNEIDGTTKINLTDADLNQAVAGTANQDIVIEATADTESFGVVAGVAGGTGAVSAIVDMHLLRSTVETNIARSDLTAERNISIGSKNSDDTNTVFVGVAAGGVAVPVNAEGIIATSNVKTMLDGGSATTASKISAGNDLEVYAESLLDIHEVNVSVAGGVVGAGIAFAINNLEQNTSVTIGGKYDLISGNTLSVRSKGETVFSEHIDALGTGTAGVGGAMGLVFADSYTEIAFAGTDVNLEGKDIEIEADDIFTQKLSTVGGFAVGLVGAAGGLNVLELHNGAVIRGYADMTATESITASVTVTRNIEDLITIAGGAGIYAGLAGTISHITIGAAQGSNEGVEETLDVFANADFGDPGTTRTENLFGQVQGMVDKRGNPQKQSAALTLGGNLQAASITLEAVTENMVNTTAAGIGAGGVIGVGGALVYVNVKDNITASFVGNATAHDFILQGKSINSGHTTAIAGGGAIIFGAAGAGNWTTFTSDIHTSIGEASVIEGTNVLIRSDQNFNDIVAKADAGAIAGIGVGGAEIALTFDGNSIVHIAENAEIYAGMIDLAARKNYSGNRTDAYALAGGLAGGAGVGSLLKIVGDAQVVIADDVLLRSSRTNLPLAFSDTITVTSAVNIDDVSSSGVVDSGGLVVAAFGNTDLEMNFNAFVDIGSAKLVSGTILLDAYRNLTGTSAHHSTDTGGLAVAAGGNATVELAGGNRIDLSGSFLEAWNSLTLSAGRGTTTLDAQTRVFNGGVVPVTGGIMVDATMDIAVANEINLADSVLRSVSNITALAGQESYTAVAYASTQYLYTGGVESFIQDNDFSIKESTGTVKTENSNTIALGANNTLEAGIHWNTAITVNEDTTVDKPDWVDLVVADGEVSMYDLLMTQIRSLEEKMAMAGEFPDQVGAYQVEIDYLKNQLGYYLVDPNGALTDSGNYQKANIIQICNDIIAAAGDIFFVNGTTSSTATNSITAASGNTLTAHGSPRIEIVNDSDYFLEILDVSLTIPNPLYGGGRILVNGNAVDVLGNATLVSDKDGTPPQIVVRNTSDGGTGLAPELFLTNAALNNPGGAIELDSVGSIWLNNTSLYSRDIAITTAGSFYQGYRDGRFDTGGNPFASASEIMEAINKWMNEVMFFGASNTFDAAEFQKIIADAKAAFKDATGFDYTSQQVGIDVINAYSQEMASGMSQLATAVDWLRENSTAESWGSQVRTENGVTYINDPSELVAVEGVSADIFNDYRTSYDNAVSGLQSCQDILASSQSLHDRIRTYEGLLDTIGTDISTVGAAFAGYNDAVVQLQNAVTTESWFRVFGTGGSGDTSQLVSRDGGSLDVDIANYNTAKGAYEGLLSMAATAYIAGKIKTYDDARAVSSGNEANLEMKDQAESQVSGASSSRMILGADALPKSTGLIYGQRSVLISAETLNINGLIHSGSLEYNIDLTSDVVTEAINAGQSDLTEIVFGERYNGTSPKIYYRDGTVTIDDLVAMGGNITLYGNIISTGNGELRVEDGYGNITVTVPDAMNVVLGKVDAGLGAEGTITVYDTSKGTDGQPLKTVYARKNGVYYRNGQIVDGTGLNYETTRDRWLQTIVGTSSTLAWKYTYDLDIGYAFGIPGDWMAKDDSYVTDTSANAVVNKRTPVGTFLVEGLNLGDGTLYGSYERTASAPTEDHSVHDTGWVFFGHRHYYYNYEAEQNFEETYSTYLNASRPIAITFTGNESVGNVNIAGAKTVTFASLARGAGDTIGRAADDYSVKTTGDIVGLGTIIAKNVDLRGANIGTRDRAIQIESVRGGTTINAHASGLVNLAVSSNPLLVDSITGHDVIVTSTDSVLMKAGGTGITAGNDLTISVGSGTIAGADPNADFEMVAKNNVNLTATGDIRIRHDGTLHVDRIATGIDGDLYITVLGDILDKNPEATPDPLSDAQASDLWDMLGLIEGTDDYDRKIAQKIAAYENEFTQLYFEAWRSAGLDKAGYDPEYVFSYTETQKDILRNSQWSEDRIAAEEQKRTIAYHNALSADYDENYRYVASPIELPGYAGWTEGQLKNAFNIPMFILTQDAGSRNNTTSLMETPNFTGRNITISATGSIGSQESGVDIPVGVSSAQFAENDQWRRAVADAEWDDVTFGTDFLTIKRYDDINVQASGWLKTESKNGATYLGSQTDVAVNEIVSGTDGTMKGTQPFRFKIDGNMIPYADRTHIFALNAVLEAAGGTLGAVDSPLVLNLTGGGSDTGWITARGTNGVHLSFVDASGSAADAYIREIGSRQGTVNLAARTFSDAQSDLEFAKIGGKDIVLTATGGGIGPMLISQMVGGSLTVWADGDVNLRNATGPLDIAAMFANGDVQLDAYLNLTVTGDFTVTGDVFLESVFGKLQLTDAVFDVLGDAKFSAAAELLVTGGDADFDGNLALISGKQDIIVADWSAAVLGTLDVSAANHLSLVNSDIVAGNTNLSALGGDMSINGGTANLGDTSLNSGNTLSTNDWRLNVDGTLGMDTSNTLSVTNSHITAGDTNLNSTGGDVVIDGGTFDLDNALLTSGNDVTISNVPQFDVEDYFGIHAGNRLTLRNVAGSADVADFVADRYTLDRWSIYSDEMWIGGFDIYNDVVYKNSLVYDRIIRLNTSDAGDNDDDDDEKESEEATASISGSWLSASVDFLKTLNESGPAIVPIMENSTR